jgi:hypothetical protein
MHFLSIEYVYDNTLNPAQNIWKGLRWKTYMDFNIPMSKGVSQKFNFNFGFDVRNYLEIYRNFIWAVQVQQVILVGATKK